MTTRSEIAKRREAPLRTPSNLGAENVQNLTAELNVLLADVFATYIKTKNFHWHLSGPHFRDYHLLFDEQAEQVFAMTDDIAERVRKLGGTTICSIGHAARLKHIADNNAEYVEALDMIGELREDNQVEFLATLTSPQYQQQVLSNWRVNKQYPARLGRSGTWLGLLDQNRCSLSPRALAWLRNLR